MENKEAFRLGAAYALFSVRHFDAAVDEILPSVTLDGEVENEVFTSLVEEYLKPIQLGYAPPTPLMFLQAIERWLTGNGYDIGLKDLE